MRLFIAIEFPENIKEYLVNLQQNIQKKDNIRLVNKNRIHLTLKFLGDVDQDKIEKIINNLEKISFKPFSVHLSGISFFPSEKYIRVIWVGLYPEELILQLQTNIDENLKSFFNKEKKFKVHITLARVKFVDDKKSFIGNLKKIKVDNKKFKVENFKLIKSILTPTGPIYENLKVFG